MTRPAAPFHGAGELLVGEVAGGRASLAVGEELVPAAAPLRVLAERLPEQLAAGAALLPSQAIDLVGELRRERDGQGVRAAHEGSVPLSVTSSQARCRSGEPELSWEPPK